MNANKKGPDVEAVEAQSPDEKALTKGTALDAMAQAFQAQLAKHLAELNRREAEYQALAEENRRLRLALEEVRSASVVWSEISVREFDRDPYEAA